VLETVTCVVPRCDGPSDGARCESDGGWEDWHEQGTELHYETPGQACRALVYDDAPPGESWEIDTTSGVVRCPSCVAAAYCAANGHDWEPWRPCFCGDKITAHAAAGCPQVRFCRRARCSEFEERPHARA
jgi:hypothetical protein